MREVDQGCMVLAGFMLHRYTSFLFSCNMIWTVYVRALQSHFHSSTWSTYCTFRNNLPSWPPNGYIIAVVVLLGLIIFHAIVLVGSIMQIISFHFRKIFSREL